MPNNFSSTNAQGEIEDTEQIIVNCIEAIKNKWQLHYGFDRRKGAIPEIFLTHGELYQQGKTWLIYTIDPQHLLDWLQS